MIPPVLVVDDDEDDLFLFKTAYAKLKLKNPVMTFESGAHLFCALKSMAVLPALIVLDLNMPGQNGCQVLNELRMHQRYNKIPVVMLSTSAEQTGIDRAYELGANSYLTKPFTYSDTLNLIKMLQVYWLETNQSASIDYQPD